MKRAKVLTILLFLFSFFAPLALPSGVSAHSIILSNAYKSFVLGYEERNGPKDNRYVLSLHPVYFEKLFHPEVHETNKKPRGFLDFLSLKLSYQRDENSLWLERIDLFNIVIYLPESRFGYYQNSVTAYLGIIRRDFSNGAVSETMTLNFGEGQSVDL
ncbi:MAG: hypothetical protein OEZ32_05625 [Nitrospinota bacterium]|nr:hypothetical protein [Nitrospinota bacterium]